MTAAFSTSTVSNCLTPPHPLSPLPLRQGAVGTAGVWPNPGRKITGVIMHSPAEFHPRHTALASLVNVTFMNYTGGQFYALEFCGK